MPALNLPLPELSQSGISLPDSYYYVKDATEWASARDRRKNE
jgi:predicted metalloendopeptidase